MKKKEAYLDKRGIVPCPPPFLTLPLSKKEKLLVPSDLNIPGFFDGFCIYKKCIPTSHLQKKFLMYTIFVIILNLFNSNTFYAVSTHIENYANKMHRIWRSIQN